MPVDPLQKYAPVVLRLGLAILYLWFGVSEITNTGAWTTWVPAWATAMTGLSAETIVQLNAAFEILAGALLAIGLLTRWIALALGLHMVLLVFEIGFNAIGMRDFAIMMATFALALFGADAYTLDKRLNRT